MTQSTRKAFVVTTRKRLGLMVAALALLAATLSMIVGIAVPAAGAPPSLAWARAMGGTGGDAGIAVAVDAAGNIYTTGRFAGTADFDPGPGVVNLTSAGGDDVFVSKLDSGGNLVWARAMGDTGTDQGEGVAVDTGGNVYITGSFAGTADFDPGPGVSNLASAGSNDVFVSKLDSSGNLVWAKAMGGTGFDRGHGIALDAAGNVYTTGGFQGTADFDPGAGVFNPPSAGSSDVFVSKLDSSGNFVWARAMGGTGTDQVEGVAVDATGNVYTTGWFPATADFDPGPGVSNLASAGSADVFVSKLDSGGNFVWAGGMGGTGGDVGFGVAVDAAGNVYTTGRFQGTADFDPGPGVSNLASAGGLDVFVSKLDGSGNLVWARAMGGTGTDQGVGAAVDTAGNVYTTGSFEGTADFDPGPGVSNLASAGSADVFVSKLDIGGTFVWAGAMGGTGFDVGLGVALDATGNVYTTGQFQGTADFDPGPGVVNPPSAGSSDVFVSKLSDVIAPVVTVTAPAAGAAVAQNAVVLADYSCTDDSGGSGMASCVGDVANGAAIDTATPGAKTFTVTGTDNAGNVTVVTHSYTVTAVTPLAHDVGLVDPVSGMWHLRKATTGAITSFTYGVPGDIPFIGDWDCNGTETPGLYRQSDGFAYIRNSNTFGIADVTFFMGNPSDIPLAGDFNGDGCDTVSIYRPSEQRIYIANTLGPNNGAISADFSYIFGNPSDKPFVGDFNGNGVETIGLHRESTGFVYFRNTHTIGNADVDYFFGDPGDRLVAGDWGVVDGVFTPAVFRPSNQTFYFRHTNTQGNADSQFVWPQPGASTWRPVSGVMGL